MTHRMITLLGGALLAAGLQAGEAGFGFQVGLYQPSGGVRERFSCGRSGWDLGLALAQPLGARQELRLEVGLAMGSDGRAWRPHALGEAHLAGDRDGAVTLRRYGAGVAFRHYPAGVGTGPFLSVGVGVARLASHHERFVPRSVADCHRDGHQHGRAGAPAPAVVSRQPPHLRPVHRAAPNAWLPAPAVPRRGLCGHRETQALADSRFRPCAHVGAGVVLAPVELGVRLEALSAFGRTLTALTFSVGVRI
ncbi:hypothetical protein [Mesoterricola sediminis]|uniref:Outer membrane protein beta-barrel domain-containing protein n=1 Tax=Mesoterricola sediminis TaxID=2927980 RepID=A0AA48KCY1_9BACT|nr:hypothetical protein [Mesoterricola sediminis]BDU77601.1 hypothetical protein METESE_25590 [Mesoterricola sediminis]